MSDSEDDYNEEWQENSSDSEDSDEDWDDGGPAKKKAKGRGATKKGKGSAAAEEQPARRKGKAKPKELTKEQKEVRETADRLKRAAERNGILGRTSSAGQPTDVPPGSPQICGVPPPPSPAERACVRACSDAAGAVQRRPEECQQADQGAPRRRAPPALCLRGSGADAPVRPQFLFQMPGVLIPEGAGDVGEVVDLGSPNPVMLIKLPDVGHAPQCAASLRAER